MLSSGESRVDFLENLDVAIKHWRKVYEKEIATGSGSRKLQKMDDSVLKDFLAVKRPFFTSLTGEDTFYVTTFRMIEFSSLRYSMPSKIATMRIAGFKLGQELVKQGLIRSLDDAPLVLAIYKVGLLDIVKESLNNFKLNIYECISCYGLPNLGQTMCDYEAGILQGILSELYGSNIVKEKYCWGTGYSFCGFEVYFE